MGCALLTEPFEMGAPFLIPTTMETLDFKTRLFLFALIF